MGKEKITSKKKDKASIHDSIKELVDSLALRTQKEASKVQGPLVKDFVHYFYTNPAKESLTRLPRETLVGGLFKIWSFFYERKKNAPKLRVYYWKPKKSLTLSERIVIDIVNDNMSFLLDSLYGLLHRLGTEPRLTFHPIMKVQRNKAGKIINITSPQNTHSKGALESIIHCEIVDNISPQLVKELKKRIPEMLQDVRWANKDWTPMRKKTLEIINEIESYRKKGFLKENIDEVINFLKWIEDEHFTYLGYCNYELAEDEPSYIAHRVKTERPLGILKKNLYSDLRYLFEGIAVSKDTKNYLFSSFPIIINKTSHLSNVHRNVQMDCIGIRRYDEHGNVIGLRLFVGLFTSIAYDSSARDIPLLRTKIAKIIEKVGFTFDWHDGKALIHILDSLPRDELFQASIRELTEIGLSILRLQERQRLAFFVRRDQFNRFLSCLVYIPRDRFDSELCDRIGDILAHEFDGNVGVYKAQFGALPFARVHYIITSEKGLKKKYDTKRIEKYLIQESRTWVDELKSTLNEYYHEVQSAYLYRRYYRAFDTGYQELYKGKQALDDILELEEVYKQNPFRVRIYSYPGTDTSCLKLKIYNLGGPLPLSDVLPILENLDLRVVSEIPYKVTPTKEKQPTWIHDFDLVSRGACPIDAETSYKTFEDTLIKVRNEDIENDGFNRLVLRANLNWWQCIIFRAYAKYLRLIELPFSKAYISTTLIKNPKIVKLLAELFENRFHPHKGKKCPKLIKNIQDLLEKIENADEDRILRLYLTIILATVRTNAYQVSTKGEYKPYISFKISSKEIEGLPKPRPLYEIFVYASLMEALHLRGGKVARGGIRWSDRQEDFRTEILGLVKAQMVKNTVIVPVGSKGGFIVKTPLEGKSREEVYKEGVKCYQMMIQGLLDITDNLIDREIIPPKNVVRWDTDDPYLVVAADKGTATFSDLANKISKQYNFWLGDAFASGGSTGYDHKKMGITARGAWESVKRHFRESGIHTQKDPISVIGIGDMSGDVFGNGMLLSHKIKLVAAFNHRHIFIDPDPDPNESFKERKRLFKLRRSTWDDYNKTTLSKGGGVYSRHAKIVRITTEIVSMLDLKAPSIHPDELIKAILTHKADFLWLGGIGTYIKASTESHNDVGDRSNDSVRVDAKNLNVRVIGEGANLGCTQLARIEFERRVNGHINTDAIDNSAGVSCSDREVNIKILFNEIMRHSKLTLKKRNELLEQMTDDVSRLVLKDNYLQPQAITMITSLGSRNFDQQIQLIRLLEQEGALDRQLEYLPDDTTLEEYQATQTYLTRPEVATLMGFSKISFYDKILQTKIPDDPFFIKPLKEYFPSLLQKKYEKEILKHPLRREIIATYVVNKTLNRIGGSYISEAMKTTGASLEDVFKAFFTTVTTFDLENVWSQIEKLDYKVLAKNQTQVFLDVHEILRRTTMWLLRYYPMADTIKDTANILGIGIESFLSNVMDSLNDNEKDKLAQIIKHYKTLNLPKTLRERLALLQLASTSPDIILIASETGYTVPETAELYFKVGQIFYFVKLREIIEKTKISHTSWERRLTSNLLEDLYNYQSDLVVNMLEYADKFKINTNDHFKALLSKWVEANRHQIDNIEHAIKESQIETKPDLTALSIIVRDLRHLSGN